MSVFDTIRPEVLENWPVLDEQPGEGVIVWLEFAEDFLGHRVKMRFPFIPNGPGQRASALNVPITLSVDRERERWIGRRWWKVDSGNLWSEPEGGVRLTYGARINVSMSKGDHVSEEKRGARAPLSSCDCHSPELTWRGQRSHRAALVRAG